MCGMDIFMELTHALLKRAVFSAALALNDGWGHVGSSSHFLFQLIEISGDESDHNCCSYLTTMTYIYFITNAHTY